MVDFKQKALLVRQAVKDGMKRHTDVIYDHRYHHRAHFAPGYSNLLSYLMIRNFCSWDCFHMKICNSSLLQGLYHVCHVTVISLFLLPACLFTLLCKSEAQNTISIGQLEKEMRTKAKILYITIVTNNDLVPKCNCTNNYLKTKQINTLVTSGK